MWVPVLSTTRPLPGAVALRAHLLDMAAHAWDVAAAVRRPLTVPPEVAAIALEVAEGIPDGPDRREPDSLFAPRSGLARLRGGVRPRPDVCSAATRARRP